MKIAYFTSHIYEPDFISAPIEGKKPNPAGQNFHEKVIKALSGFAEVDVYSYLPLNMDLPEKDFQVESGIRYHYVKASKNKVIRALFGPGKLAGRAHKNVPDFIFFDSLNRSTSKAAIRLALTSGAKAVAILTDHPNNITGLKPSYSNAILSCAAKASACFALTPKLVEAFGFLGRPHLIQPVLVEKEPIEPYKHESPYIYYGGALYLKDGLSDLLSAYLTTNPKYDLIITGHGPFDTEILKAAEHNPRIIFRGQVSKKEHLSLIAGSALSINPRRYDKKIDDYAVPSKVMEYLCYAPYVASTKSTALMETFRHEINWIHDGTLTFFREFLNNDGLFEGLKKNTAQDRVISEFGIEETSRVLREFLAKLSD